MPAARHFPSLPLCSLPITSESRRSCRLLVQRLGHRSTEEMQSQGDCENRSMFRSATRRTQQVPQLSKYAASCSRDARRSKQAVSISLVPTLPSQGIRDHGFSTTVQGEWVDRVTNRMYAHAGGDQDQYLLTKENRVAELLG